MRSPVHWFARATIAALGLPFLLVLTIALTIDTGALVAVIGFGLFLAPALLVLAGGWLLDHLPTRTVTPHISFGWREVKPQPSRSAARRLAEEARDNATKAGLRGPTAKTQTPPQRPLRRP